MSGPRVVQPLPATGHAGTRQRGLGIIEVLVALVVVSLGVLGIAGMQMTGMQHGTGSLNRAKALAFAEDMAERLRVNTDGGIANPLYDRFDSAAEAGLCDAAPTPYCDAANGKDADECGGDALAEFDLASVSCGAWSGADAAGGVANGGLPGGTLAIDCEAPCDEQSVWTVAVGWTEGTTTSDVDAEVGRRVTMRLRP